LPLFAVALLKVHVIFLRVVSWALRWQVSNVASRLQTMYCDK